MNEKEVCDVGQSMVEVTNGWPGILYRFYNNSIEQGFTRDQAFSLTTQFMKSLIGSCKDSNAGDRL